MQREEESPDPEEMVWQLNSAMIMAGQIMNQVAYERRVLALTAVTGDGKNARKQLRETISKE